MLLKSVREKLQYYLLGINQLMVIVTIELFTIVFNAQRTFLHRLHKEKIQIRVPKIPGMLRHTCRVGEMGQLGFTGSRI